MVTIRNVNEIILNLIDFYRVTVPDLDTKPGTVARDLFIDAPASQISIIYDELSSVSNKQSLRLVVGSDLDKLAKNFGVVRKQSTTSTGVALLTFKSLTSPINIDKGSTVIASNGFAYAVVNGVSVSSVAANFYRSVASKFSDQLAFAGITDEFAVEVTVTATSPGSSGNIGTYSLSRTSIPGISNVTNINPFVGGTDQESDASFRNRILSAFSGSSVGTALGYLNVAIGTTGVSDAYVVQPGDVLMTRDGTVVSAATDGTRTIKSEGSGGKVDVVILGSNLIQNTDSFIYQDKSNSNNPASTKNDFILGQITADANKTVNRKRIDNIAAGVLPIQPAESIIQVSGSLSGANFAEKTVDSLGRVSGNYELVKDTGVYRGSPWGFDKFRWINDRVTFQEDVVKGQAYGQDSTSFTGVTEIPRAQQSITITNENSTVTTDRSIIQLLHYPANNVTRVFNVNTGERYIITNQNFDNTGTFNTTGRIKISGNTLPSPSDLLQVDYSWIVDYDQYSDYDGLINTKNGRTVTDSVDWGTASFIKNELVTFTLSGTSNFFTGTTSHPVNTIFSVSKFLETDGVVQKVTTGVFVNRLSVVISNLINTTVSVDSVTFKNTNVELYKTPQNNGNFSNAIVVVGINVLNNTTIILPTDTTAVEGDRVTAILDSTDVYSGTSITGSASGTQVSVPSSLLNTTATSINLRVNYIADISDLFFAGTTSLPASRIGNGFVLNNNGFNNFSIVNASRREHQVVQKNFSNQFYLELTLPSADYAITTSQVVVAIRLSDRKLLWDNNNTGTISIGDSGNYQLILSGYNTPVAGDRVLIVYYSTDSRRYQPFSFSNQLIKTRIDSLDVEPVSGKFMVPINSITTQTVGLNFKIIEPNTDIVLYSVTDGYMVSSGGTATLTSTTSFTTLADILLKKVVISGATNSNNNGTYDIISYNQSNNTMVITNVLTKIVPDQISVIRVLDGKELWSNTGTTIDLTNNRLLIPNTPAAQIGDAVFVVFFSYKNLRKSPTRLLNNLTDQIVNTGVVSISGHTITKAEDIIFTATGAGLKLSINEAIRKALNISSVTAIPTNVKIVRLSKLEKVITAGNNNDEVVSVSATMDIKNVTIQNALYYNDEAISNYSLGNLDMVLPSTTNNLSNIPATGDKFRITFYYITENDSENLSYTRNGTLYTNKKFAVINKVFVSSGFSASQSTKFTITSFTQPNLGARYKVFYDYLAPKQNERIVITYNYNKLITDVTFNIENTRPINADVLVRASTQTLLDLDISVVISSDFLNTSTTVLQNLKNQLITTMTTTKLGDIVDVVTIINVAQAVQGIARARVSYFNKTGGIGQVLSVQAQNDEYFAANQITINTETR